jgi:hypothetical protein
VLNGGKVGWQDVSDVQAYVNPKHEVMTIEGAITFTDRKEDNENV